MANPTGRCKTNTEPAKTYITPGEACVNPRNTCMYETQKNLYKAYAKAFTDRYLADGDGQQKIDRTHTKTTCTCKNLHDSHPKPTHTKPRRKYEAHVKALMMLCTQHMVAANQTQSIQKLIAMNLHIYETKRSLYETCIKAFMLLRTQHMLTANRNKSDKYQNQHEPVRTYKTPRRPTRTKPRRSPIQPT